MSIDKILKNNYQMYNKPYFFNKLILNKMNAINYARQDIIQEYDAIVEVLKVLICSLKVRWYQNLRIV